MDLAQVGDDVEPIEAPREDVKWDTMKTKNH